MLWVSHVLAVVGPLDQTSDLRLASQRASWGGYPSFPLLLLYIILLIPARLNNLCTFALKDLLASGDDSSQIPQAVRRLLGCFGDGSSGASFEAARFSFLAPTSDDSSASPLKIQVSHPVRHVEL